MTVTSDQTFTVSVRQEGRSGTVLYREGSNELKFYWEFGTGEALISIYLGTIEEWQQYEGWCRERRGLIASRISEEIARSQLPPCVGQLDSQPGYLDIITQSRGNA